MTPKILVDDVVYRTFRFSTKYSVYRDISEIEQNLDMVTMKEPVGVDPGFSAVNMRLPAFAAERGRLQQVSIDSWYAASSRRSAANRQHAAAAVDRRDRRTDGHLTVKKIKLAHTRLPNVGFRS